MRSVSTNFNTRSIAYSSTSLCAICVITLFDGTVIYLTDHDVDINYGGHIYRSDLGFTPSAVQLALGVSAETQTLVVLPADGANSGGEVGISRAMIFNGRVLNASVVYSWLDYQNPGYGQLDIFSGNVTAATFSDFGLITLSVQSVLGRELDLCADKYSQTCRYDFGDSGCGVDIGPTIDGPYVHDIVDYQTFHCGVSETSPDGYYNNGMASFTTGPCAGLAFEIATNTFDTTVTPNRMLIQLKVPMPELPNVGTTVPPADIVTLTAGCDKTVGGGCTYWANVPRFGGEPFVTAASVAQSATPAPNSSAGGGSAPNTLYANYNANGKGITLSPGAAALVAQTEIAQPGAPFAFPVLPPGVVP